jgi:hypothetical protein
MNGAVLEHRISGSETVKNVKRKYFLHVDSGALRRSTAFQIQYAASVAACAFDPKLATQTLITADHTMGAAA